jgi:hypothetical protein
MKFTYVGNDAQEAEIGSVHEFDEDPHDSRWELVVETPAKPAKADKEPST